LFRYSKEIFAVSLVDDEELYLMMPLLGIVLPPPIFLPLAGEFEALFDYSDQFLPILRQDDFDAFYEAWLRQSGRETSMDEYGQVLFFQPSSSAWNARASRFILRESLPLSASVRPEVVIGVKQ